MPEPDEKNISVALPLPVYKTFDYLVKNVVVSNGVRVKVPFANRNQIGIVVSIDQDAQQDRELKQVENVLDEAPLWSESTQRFFYWVADYYLQPLGEILALALPIYLKKGAKLKNTQQSVWLACSKEIDLSLLQKKAPKQYLAYQTLLTSEQGLSLDELRKKYAVNKTHLNALLQKGLVRESSAECFSTTAVKTQAQVVLNDEQQQAVAAINLALSAFSTHVIDGVTGSGKTEVYFAVMQQVLAQGKQVLFMLPEIGLTNAFIKRISERFGEKIAVLHSAKTAWQRYVAWDQAKRGVADIVIATRSGIFVEFDKLGLIIIDEEHDLSYRQQEGVYYHGRDCAIKRAQMLDIPIVLGSATPSLETLKNIQSGLYQCHPLRQRATRAKMPLIKIVNTKDKPLPTGCSQTLLKAMEQHLANNKQIILFLNRRGFAPLLMCHECGWRKLCDQCDVPMSLHVSVNRMVCHHCGFQQLIPTHCGDCGSEDIQHYGIGTQQLEQHIKQLFPDHLVARIDRDSTRLKNSFEQKMELLQSGQSGIFIGTQMLAKGHDYSGISLVGILNIDQGLYSTQLRATEMLAQTVIQVAGRAGRSDVQGEVILQTDFPDHPLMSHLVEQNYQAIGAKLLAERKLLDLPPYHKLVSFRAESPSLEQAESLLEQIKDRFESANMSDVHCIGPFPAYLKKQNKMFRAQMHLHSANGRYLRALIKQLMPELLSLKKPKLTRWRVDVDPAEI